MCLLTFKGRGLPGPLRWDLGVYLEETRYLEHPLTSWKEFSLVIFKNTYCWCSHAWHFSFLLVISGIWLKTSASALYLFCSSSFSPSTLPYSTLHPSVLPHHSPLKILLILVLLNVSVNLRTIYYFYDSSYVSFVACRGLEPWLLASWDALLQWHSLYVF